MDAAETLVDLRRARRRRRTSDIDVFEALYRSYLTAVFVGLVILLLSGITGDKRVDHATLDRVKRNGPAAAGLAGAFVVAVGLRSGGRGGPLVIEAADVRHVLLSPVDRTMALRGPAFRQLRFAGFTGGAAGAAAGILAMRRLPGTPGFWVATGAAAGALIAILAIGAGILMSGNRIGRIPAQFLAVLVLGWSVLDLTSHRATSPLTFLGKLALWPLHVDPLAFIGVAVALAVPAMALPRVGGTSLEAAERRASLAGQLRFAATLQDLRTVIVLRRQLAQERPRTRPWLQLPRPKPGTDGPARPVWRRGWHGILRWPFSRVARLVLLAAIAGVSLAAAWRGTTPLVVVAGLALFVAALDAVEPLAQDVDHPDRIESVPMDAGDLQMRHLPASIIVMLGIGIVAGAAALAVARDPGLVLPVAGALVVPAAAISAGAAAMSVIKGPGGGTSAGFFVPPEAAGMQVVYRVAWPPILCVVSLLPLFAARQAHKHGMPIAGPLLGAEAGVVVVAVIVLLWVRWQQRVHAALESSMQSAQQARTRG